jgi:hypothetical protein
MIDVLLPTAADHQYTASLDKYLNMAWSNNNITSHPNTSQSISSVLAYPQQYAFIAQPQQTTILTPLTTIVGTPITLSSNTLANNQSISAPIGTSNVPFYTVGGMGSSSHTTQIQQSPSTGFRPYKIIPSSPLHSLASNTSTYQLTQYISPTSSPAPSVVRASSPLARSYSRTSISSPPPDVNSVLKPLAVRAANTSPPPQSNSRTAATVTRFSHSSPPAANSTIHLLGTSLPVSGNNSTSILSRVPHNSAVQFLSSPASPMPPSPHSPQVTSHHLQETDDTETDVSIHRTNNRYNHNLTTVYRSPVPSSLTAVQANVPSHQNQCSPQPTVTQYTAYQNLPVTMVQSLPMTSINTYGFTGTSQTATTHAILPSHTTLYAPGNLTPFTSNQHIYSSPSSLVPMSISLNVNSSQPQPISAFVNQSVVPATSLPSNPIYVANTLETATPSSVNTSVVLSAENVLVASPRRSHGKRTAYHLREFVRNYFATNADRLVNKDLATISGELQAAFDAQQKRERKEKLERGEKIEDDEDDHIGKDKRQPVFCRTFIQKVARSMGYMLTLNYGLVDKRLKHMMKIRKRGKKSASISSVRDDSKHEDMEDTDVDVEAHSSCVGSATTLSELSTIATAEIEHVSSDSSDPENTASAEDALLTISSSPE